nr:hypothetical protein [Propionimicrobium lymphophilum]
MGVDTFKFYGAQNVTLDSGKVDRASLSERLESQIACWKQTVGFKEYDLLAWLELVFAYHYTPTVHCGDLDTVCLFDWFYGAYVTDGG